MTGMTASRSFQWARLFAWIGIISIAAMAIGFVLASVPLPPYDYIPAPNVRDIGYMMLLVSLLALIVSMIGAASTILLGWRTDRREFRLKIEQFEGQLSQTRDRATNTSRESN